MNIFEENGGKLGITEVHIRRLQKISTGSYIVSLPSNWVRFNNLNIHDPLLIINNGKFLIIKPANQREIPTHITLNIDSLTSLDINTLLYVIQMYYLQGVDNIDVISNTIIPAEVKKKIKNLLNVLPNIDINDLSSNLLQIKINDIHKFNDRSEIINIFINIFKFTLKLLEDFRQIFVSNNDVIFMQELIERSKDLKKRYMYIIRVLAKMSQVPEYNVLSIREIVIYAEIARDIFQLVNHIANAVNYMKESNINYILNNMNLNSNILNIIDILISMFKDIINYFDNREVSLIMSIKDKMNKIRALESDVLIRFIDSNQCIADKDSNKRYDSIRKFINFMYFIRELRRIAGYCIALMDDISQLYLSPP